MNNFQLVRAILFQMERSQRAYDQYRKNRVYLHACNIYKGNCKVVELINAACGSLEEPLRGHLLDLLEHLDVWMEQFRHLEKDLHPGADTEFIFSRIPNTPPFPVKTQEFLKSLANETTL